jgi:hypothetical protein
MRFEVDQPLTRETHLLCQIARIPAARFAPLADDARQRQDDWFPDAALDGFEIRRRRWIFAMDFQKATQRKSGGGSPFHG